MAGMMDFDVISQGIIKGYLHRFCIVGGKGI
jgi:hypothetical protein